MYHINAKQAPLNILIKIFSVELLAHTNMLPARQPLKTFLSEMLELTYKNTLFCVLHVGAKVWNGIPQKC